MKKYRTALCVIVLTLAICLIYYALRPKAGNSSKKYLVHILNGTPRVPYESRLEIDSFSLFSPNRVVVYIGKDSLSIRASHISIQKN
jgi:hypothetical protein